MAEDAFTFLMSTAGLSLRGMGYEVDESGGIRPHNRVYQDVRAAMAQLFQRYVYGDGASGYFYRGGEGANDSVYVFNGRCFEEQDKGFMRALVKRVLAESGVSAVYETGVYGHICDNCLDGMRGQAELFERDRRYLVFNNGVLDLEEGRMLEFSNGLMTDLEIDADYEEGYRFPLWERFIVQTVPSEDMRKAFQMFCGAFLVERRRAKIEFACYLIGGGRNGKSVAVSAISNVFGSKLVSWFSPQQLFNDNTCMYNRAKTDGKFANFSDDVKASDYSGGDFKQFVSGQPFEARNPYGTPYTMKSVPFMVLCVNSMPPTTDDTNGHYRRILPIICPNKIADEDVDPELTKKLQTADARKGIFNWIYEGYKMLRDNNWKVSIGQNVVEAQQELMADSNSFRRFLRDGGYKPWYPDVSGAAAPTVGGEWKSRKDLMGEYTKYCEDMSENPKSMKSVGMILSDLGYEKRRVSTGYEYAVMRQGTYGSEVAGSQVRDEDLPF